LIFPIFPVFHRMIHKFLYYVKNSARKDTSIVKSYITTKRGKAVAASILMPPRLADAWLAASALEGISRQEFLRRSLDERATRIFSAYLHPQTQVEEIEPTPQTVTEISMLATHSETDGMRTVETGKKWRRRRIDSLRNWSPPKITAF